MAFDDVKISIEVLSLYRRGFILPVDAPKELDSDIIALLGLEMLRISTHPTSCGIAITTRYTIGYVFQIIENDLYCLFLMMDD